MIYAILAFDLTTDEWGIVDIHTGSVFSRPPETYERCYTGDNLIAFTEVQIEKAWVDEEGVRRVQFQSGQLPHVPPFEERIKRNRDFLESYLSKHGMRK